MADDTNTAEREAAERWLRDRYGAYRGHFAWRELEEAFLAGRASLAASAGSTEINGQLYTALNNLFTHLGMEGCITADHAFVWDAMTALKRIDGGVHLDNLAVPVDPDAHRDDMLAAVQLLEDGEWAEHFAKTPIGMRLEDQITKLHSEVAASAGSEPVAPVDRSDAVNLARNMLEVHKCKGITPRGVETLCKAVLAMDAVLLAHPSPPEGSAPAAPPMDGEIALIEKAVKRVGIKSLLNHGAGSLVYSEGVEGVTQDDLLAYTREIALHCAVALCSPQEGMAGWKPIETAPKDGTEILLRSARGRVADGAWGQPDGWANPNCWVWPYINQEPTHWMPLPASEAKEL